MTPVAQTLYSAALFLALVSLLLKINRRRRDTRMARRAAAALSRQDNPA